MIVIMRAGYSTISVLAYRGTSGEVSTEREKEKEREREREREREKERERK